jgi:hypothetical protein
VTPAKKKTRSSAREGKGGRPAAPRDVVPKAHWPDAQRLVSTRYLLLASGGWDQVPGGLARRGEDASDALAIARILRATLRAMLQTDGQDGERYRKYLREQAEQARQLLEHDFATGFGMALVWHDVDGTSVVPAGDVVFEKGTEFRTFYIDSIVNTVAAWLNAPSDTQDESASSHHGVQVLIVGMAEDLGLMRLAPEERTRLLTRVQKVMRRSRDSGEEAEKTVRAALGARGLGLGTDVVKGLLSYRDKRGKRRGA